MTCPLCRKDNLFSLDNPQWAHDAALPAILKAEAAAAAAEAAAAAAAAADYDSDADAASMADLFVNAFPPQGQCALDPFSVLYSTPLI